MKSSSKLNFPNIIFIIIVSCKTVEFIDCLLFTLRRKFCENYDSSKMTVYNFAPFDLGGQLSVKSVYTFLN